MQAYGEGIKKDTSTWPDGATTSSLFIARRRQLKGKQKFDHIKPAAGTLILLLLILLLLPLLQLMDNGRLLQVCIFYLQQR